MRRTVSAELKFPRVKCRGDRGNVAGPVVEADAAVVGIALELNRSHDGRFWAINGVASSVITSNKRKGIASKHSLPRLTEQPELLADVGEKNFIAILRIDVMFPSCAPEVVYRNTHLTVS